MKNEYIYGRNPVIEALEAGQNIEKIFIQKGTHGAGIGDILRLSKNQNIPLSYIPAHKLQKIAPKNNQGVAALMSLVDYLPLQSIIDHTFAEGQTPFLVVAEGITDTRNLGAISRSAYALGAHAIVLSMKNTAPINADVIKTSAGAALHLNWAKEKNMATILDTLHQNGISTLASDLQAEQALEELDLSLPIAIILGSESEGISEQTRNSVSQTYYLPMDRDFDSLNVSVAAGISFYLVSQKRRKT